MKNCYFQDFYTFLHFILYLKNRIEFKPIIVADETKSINTIRFLKLNN